MSRANPLTTHQYAGEMVKAEAEIHSYEDCETFLAGAKEKRVASNVAIVRHKNCFAVRLYNTEILRYYPDGTFSADNGGFDNHTTSCRVNQFGPKGWYFGHGDKKLWGSGHLMSHKLHYPVTGLRLWLRIGDMGEYEEFGDDYLALAGNIVECRIELPLSWYDKGFISPLGTECSCYWGDKDGEFVAGLTKSQQREIEKWMKEELADVASSSGD